MIGVEFSLGDFGGRLGVIDVRLADRFSRGLVRKLFDPLILQACVGRIGLRRSDICASLGDFFGTTAVMKAFDDMPLDCDGGVELGDLRLEAVPLQPSHNFAGMHVIPFLHEDCADPLAAVERQLNLAQIDVAVEQELGGLRLLL